LGGAVCEFIKSKCVFGPGSLQGEPAVLDTEKEYLIWRMYEIYPSGHRLEGTRVYDRCAVELRKGVAKTELGAWICFAELHPEAEIRWDGWSPEGSPMGRPVRAPYIPMMASAEEQVQELAFGVLKWVIEHSADADMFDCSLERIVRMDQWGHNDGMAVPVSNAPATRDGARTTMEFFDEPHRLYLPRQKAAHETMIQNLAKRQYEHPWALYTSTAGQPGQGSVEEDVRHEAEGIDAGTAPNSSLFFFGRWAGDEHNDLSTVDLRIAAIADATGPTVGEWGTGQFERIAKDYDRTGIDRSYWERVYLNRWRRTDSGAFDMIKVRNELLTTNVIPKKAFVTGGFDGARFKDATAIVLTDIDTGLQQIAGIWERPPDVEAWEVDEADVVGVFEEIFTDYDVWRIYCDPPYWTETVSSLEGRHPDQVVLWWMNRPRAASYSLRAYQEAIDSALVSYGGTPDNLDAMVTHLGHAGKKELKITDDEGRPLYILQKMDGQMQNKIDAAAAGVLSWQACLDARRSGARPRARGGAPRRLY
jgi:hypothetical protein